MPDATVLDEAPPIMDPEPKDRRTNEWKAWRERNAPKVTVTIATPATDAVVPAASPASIRGKSIMPPDEFAAKFATGNSGMMLNLASQPNPVSSMAGVMLTAYRAYLALVSPEFSEHLKQDPSVRFLPDPAVIWAAYDIATGR